MEKEARVCTKLETHDEAIKLTASPSHGSNETAVFMMSCDDKSTLSQAPAVLLVGKCTQHATGNTTTLTHLGHALRAGGWQYMIRDSDSISNTATLSTLVKHHNIVIVLGLHAYRSSNVLLSCQELGMPYVTMFGGTDVNECVKDIVKRKVMDRVVLEAKSLIVFDDFIRESVLQVWPSLPSSRIWVMPQAVEVQPDTNFDVLSYLEAVESAYRSKKMHDNDQKALDSCIIDQNVEKYVPSAREYESEALDGDHSITENDSIKENCLSPIAIAGTTQDENSNSLSWRIHREPSMNVCSRELELLTLFQPLVLLVAGLRPVKDVLYLADAWSRWHRGRDGRGRFLILGPPLDPHYAAHVQAQVNSRLSGVRVCPTLSSRECQAVIRSSTVLVNSSRSESMSNAVLEAMALGTPVIARDIQGNTSVITHGHTGLIYSCPDDFIRKLERLLQDSGLKDHLVTNAKEHVIRFHSLQQEQDILVRILKDAIL